MALLIFLSKIYLFTALFSQSFVGLEYDYTIKSSFSQL